MTPYLVTTPILPSIALSILLSGIPSTLSSLLLQTLLLEMLLSLAPLELSTMDLESIFRRPVS